MLVFTVNPDRVIAAIRHHLADFDNPHGIMGKSIQSGMEEVFDRVNEKLKRAYAGPRRRYIDYRAGFTDKAAPRVVQSRIREVITGEKRRSFNIKAGGGLITFGLGNVEDLDKMTEETLISRLKAARQETPEQKRIFPGRPLYSIWQIMEFGAAPHRITPKKQGIEGLMFFHHRTGELVRGSRGTNHPGQSGKHIFLKAEHQIYQYDIDILKASVLRGLKEQIKAFY